MNTVLVVVCIVIAAAEAAFIGGLAARDLWPLWVRKTEAKRVRPRR